MARDIAVVHPGVQHSGELAASLNRAARLNVLVTRLQVGDDPPWPWNVDSVRTRLSRRIVRGLPDARIARVRTSYEVLLRGSASHINAARHRELERKLTNRFIDAAIARIGPQVKVVVGTDTASLALFRRLAVTRPSVARILDYSHPLDVAVQPFIRADAERWGLALEAYDDFRAGPPKDQSGEINQADVVLVASKFSEDTIQRLQLPGVALERVPYYIAEFRGSRRERRAGDELRVLALGAMSERKGMTLLLRAMAELQHGDHDIRLTIAGKASPGYSLPSKLPANTTYAGVPTAEQVMSLYENSDVLVLPSMCEGFGRTLLEALAAGVAVITTERSGGPDILERHPDAPVTILPVDRRDELAAVLMKHAVDPERYLRPDAARVAAQHFSEAEYLRRLERAIAVGTAKAAERLAT